MGETSLPSLMKEIGEAVKLDNDSHDKEAYKKYVSCIYKIATNLILAMKQAGGDVIVDSKTSRQVKLVQHCVERVTALVEKMDTSKSAATTPVQASPAVTPTSNHSFISAKYSAVSSQPSTPATGFPVQGFQVSPSTPQAAHGSSPEHPTSASQLDQPDGQHSRFMAVPSLPQERNPYAYSTNKSHALTPMELARKQNQNLMVAYKARMKRLNRSDFSAFNYSLTIQRKMAENIAIAQAQEEELARKMQARNLRLEQEAAKRFAAPIGMSKEEQEQRQIYKRILAYENEVVWLQNWRNKLESNPEDPILISQLVQEILRCSDHPFTELLHKYQFQIYERLYPLVVNKHQEVEKVKVPLPTDVWPSLEDVAEILQGSMGLCSPKTPSPERFVIRKEGKEAGDDKVKEEKEEGDKLSKAIKDVGNNQSCKASSHEHEEKKGKSTQNSEEDETGKTLDDRTKSNSGDSNVWDDPLNVRSELENLKNDQGGMNKHSCVSNENSADSKGCVKDNIDRDSSSADTAPKPSEEGGKESASQQFRVSGKEKVKELERTAKSQEKSDADSDGKQQNTDNEDMKSVHNDIVDGASHLTDTATRIKKDLHLALDKGKELESQLSWERRQAQILMRQVTRDYSSYNMKNSDYDDDNLDYLFDDDDDDEYNCYASVTNMSGYHQRSYAEQSNISETGESSTKSPTRNTVLDRSVSQQPTTSRLSSKEEDTRFQSLPASSSKDIPDGAKQKIQKLSREAYQRHLKLIADDIHQYLEKLLVMMTIAYEPLDTPVGKDQCAVSLEEPFFKPIWKTLLKLFRAVNHKQELVLACVMTRYLEATPEDMHISKKFWLTDAESQGGQPYQRAITELTHVKEHYTMVSKLECVVKVCRLICECVDDHYKKKDGKGETTGKKAPSIGADDLLPILSYVVIHTAMPQLGSECLALTEFIHEGYMMGEEGYCLTTLRTALNYVMSLFPSIVA